LTIVEKLASDRLKLLITKRAHGGRDRLWYRKANNQGSEYRYVETMPCPISPWEPSRVLGQEKVVRIF